MNEQEREGKGRAEGVRKEKKQERPTINTSF